MHFFDSHAHASLWRLPRGELRRIHLEKAYEAGIRAIALASADPADWPALSSHSYNYGIKLYYCLGIHPYALAKFPTEHDATLMEQLAERLEKRDDRLRAVGECGLDHRRNAPEPDRHRQREVFTAHLSLAGELGLPLVIHCVDATGAVYELLRAADVPPSVLHSYTGSAEMATRFVELGHYVSFSGAVTRPGAKRVLEAAKTVPGDRLLIETDAPDQTPHGHGPVENQPAFLVDVARTIAELRGTTTAEIAALTRANACRVYGVPDPVAR